MTDPVAFDFNDQSVATGYDNLLVPIVFEPWAVQLVETFGPWRGRVVLDLATGTGAVAEQLSRRVGAQGKVIGVDMNAAMLTLARQRCKSAAAPVEFIHSPAHSLPLPDASVDTLVCQQGFQFFPDQAAAATEMARVLCDKARVVISVWRPLTECDFFACLCAALEAVGAHELSTLMRLPFDFITDEAFVALFAAAGFANVNCVQQQRQLVVEGGVPHAIEVAYSTPIGPKLAALPAEQQDRFRQTFTELLESLSEGGKTMGNMATRVLIADNAR